MSVLCKLKLLDDAGLFLDMEDGLHNPVVKALMKQEGFIPKVELDADKIMERGKTTWVEKKDKLLNTFNLTRDDNAKGCALGGFLGQGTAMMSVSNATQDLTGNISTKIESSNLAFASRIADATREIKRVATGGNKLKNHLNEAEISVAIIHLAKSRSQDTKYQGPSLEGIPQKQVEALHELADALADVGQGKATGNKSVVEILNFVNGKEKKRVPDVGLIQTEFTSFHDMLTIVSSEAHYAKAEKTVVGDADSLLKSAEVEYSVRVGAFRQEIAYFGEKGVNKPEIVKEVQRQLKVYQKEYKVARQALDDIVRQARGQAVNDAAIPVVRAAGSLVNATLLGNGVITEMFSFGELIYMGGLKDTMTSLIDIHGTKAINQELKNLYMLFTDYNAIRPADSIGGEGAMSDLAKRGSSLDSAQRTFSGETGMRNILGGVGATMSLKQIRTGKGIAVERVDFSSDSFQALNDFISKNADLSEVDFLKAVGDLPLEEKDVILPQLQQVMITVQGNMRQNQLTGQNVSGLQRGAFPILGKFLAFAFGAMNKYLLGAHKNNNEHLLQYLAVSGLVSYAIVYLDANMRLLTAELGNSDRKDLERLVKGTEPLFLAQRAINYSGGAGFYMGILQDTAQISNKILQFESDDPELNAAVKTFFDPYGSGGQRMNIGSVYSAAANNIVNGMTSLAHVAQSPFGSSTREENWKHWNNAWKLSTLNSPHGRLLKSGAENVLDIRP